MKILIRNVDNVVIYAQSDLVLTETELQGDGWRDHHFSTLNARVEDAELPAHWAGSVWSYAGGTWAVFDQAQHDKIVQSTLPTLADLKNNRTNLVKSIVVTTSAGHAFDGDEDSQNRMARAIAGMDDTDTMLWVLSDNALITVNKTELREALRLSGIAMTTIWMVPYQAQ